MTIRQLPDFHRLISIGLVTAQESLKRNSKSADLKADAGNLIYLKLSWLRFINTTKFGRLSILTLASIRKVCVCPCVCASTHICVLESHQNSHLTQCYFKSTFFEFPKQRILKLNDWGLSSILTQIKHISSLASFNSLWQINPVTPMRLQAPWGSLKS